MVGRREKQTPHHIIHDEAQHNSGNKFRRKLSNGLAFISFTQRKNVSARQLSSNASLALSVSSTTTSSTAILDHTALLSPFDDLTSATSSIDPPAPLLEGACASKVHQPPASLPRSRTFSHIPRPVKAEGETKSTINKDGLDQVAQDTTMVDSKPLSPTRIPTPSLPRSKRRVSSPRQYLPVNPTLQEKATVYRQSFAETPNYALPKTAVRSQTTPNLTQAVDASVSANYMAPRRPGLKRLLASPAVHKPVLMENIPTGQRVAPRNSQTHDKLGKRESLAMPPAASNRRSFGPDTPLVTSRRYSLAPPVSAKRLSAHLTQKPAAAKHACAKVQESEQDLETDRSLNELSLVRVQSANSESSLTPILSTVDLIDQPLVPPSRLDVNNDAQRRTLGTPNGLGARSGAWRSSKVFAAANHQVRRLPRSSTFHHLGEHLKAPPVPAVPIQYKLLLSSSLTHFGLQQSLSTLFSVSQHPPVDSDKFGPSRKNLLSDIATAQIFAEAASLKTSSTFISTDASEVAQQAASKMSDVSAGVSTSVENINGPAYQTAASTHSSDDLSAIHVVPITPHLQRPRRFMSLSRSGRPIVELQTQRLWSTSELFYPGSANILTYHQVKDYMPPLYWAGRFQSRFDQWRTEAMVAMLNPNIKHEDQGPLWQCKIDDEKKAMILIFMQLRDLCASAQAADSLHACSPTLCALSKHN